MAMVQGRVMVFTRPSRPHRSISLFVGQLHILHADPIGSHHLPQIKYLDHVNGSIAEFASLASPSSPPREASEAPRNKKQSHPTHASRQRKGVVTSSEVNMSAVSIQG